MTTEQMDAMDDYWNERLNSKPELPDKRFMPGGGTDLDMDYNWIGSDIVWGIKTYLENDPTKRIYLFEVFLRTDDPAVPVYLREKSESLSDLTASLARVLTDSEYREELKQFSKMLQGQTGYTPHKEAKRV